MLQEMKKDLSTLIRRHKVTKLITKAIAIIISVIASLTSIAYANELPLFVTITTDTCYACKQLKPIIEELEYEYSGKVNFITLNVSSRSSIEEAKQIAQWHGIDNFFEKNKGAVPRVGILCPDKNKVEEVLTGEIRKEIYQKELDYILFDTKTVCSL